MCKIWPRFFQGDWEAGVKKSKQKSRKFDFIKSKKTLVNSVNTKLTQNVLLSIPMQVEISFKRNWSYMILDLILNKKKNIIKSPTKSLSVLTFESEKTRRSSPSQCLITKYITDQREIFVALSTKTLLKRTPVFRK